MPVYNKLNCTTDTKESSYRDNSYQVTKNLNFTLNDISKIFGSSVRKSKYTFEKELIYIQSFSNNTDEDEIRPIKTMMINDDNYKKKKIKINKQKIPMQYFKNLKEKIKNKEVENLTINNSSCLYK